MDKFKFCKCLSDVVNRIFEKEQEEEEGLVAPIPSHHEPYPHNQRRSPTAGSIALSAC